MIKLQNPKSQIARKSKDVVLVPGILYLELVTWLLGLGTWILGFDQGLKSSIKKQQPG